MKKSQNALPAMASKLSVLFLSPLISPFLPFSDPRPYVSYLSKESIHKLLHLLRCAIALSLSFLLFLLSAVLPLPLFLNPAGRGSKLSSFSRRNPDPPAPIARALSEVLSLVSAVPASSRKYEALRSLTDRLLDENLRDGFGAVNRAALSAAFSRTIRQIEADASGGIGGRQVRRILFGAVRSLGLPVGLTEDAPSISAEKLAAELLWLARRLVDCGAGEEAVLRWGSAGELAQLALPAEPRLQAALVKVSALLLKHVSELGDEGHGSEQRRSLMMLLTWLPLLCHATNGIDGSVLSSIEKAEIVMILEKMIEKLDQSNQEKALLVWLRNFASNPNSDWPDLHACYARWYSSSRKLMILQ